MSPCFSLKIRDKRKCARADEITDEVSFTGDEERTSQFTTYFSQCILVHSLVCHLPLRLTTTSGPCFCLLHLIKGLLLFMLYTKPLKKKSLKKSSHQTRRVGGLSQLLGSQVSSANCWDVGSLTLKEDHVKSTRLFHSTTTTIHTILIS